MVFVFIFKCIYVDVYLRNVNQYYKKEKRVRERKSWSKVLSRNSAKIVNLSVNIKNSS